MARAITVHVDTMKVVIVIIVIFLTQDLRVNLTLNIISGDVLRLRSEAGVTKGSIHRNLLRPTWTLSWGLEPPASWVIFPGGAKKAEVWALQNKGPGTLGSSQFPGKKRCGVKSAPKTEKRYSFCLWFVFLQLGIVITQLKGLPWRAHLKLIKPSSSPFRSD